MPVLVNINGELFPPEEARVSVFDRGFLFGDGVYETVRTYFGRPFLLDRHLARLGRSASRLWMPIPGGLDGLEREILRSLAAAGNVDSCLRIMVTRGARPGFVNLDAETAGDGLVVIIVRPFEAFDPACYENGVDVALVGVTRMGKRSLDPKIKSGNYLNNIIALHEARRQGAFECLMPNQEGCVTEGSTSNVFLVKKGVLRTPSLDCGLLDGITRSFIFEIAAEAGYRVEEDKILPADVFGADEVFLTSSLKEVMPVRSVSGQKVGDGRPGAVTQDLLRRYREGVHRLVGPGA
ncbi:MAG: aminotransferase class IV [Planctomycetes bacterium]|nr:aminotransferase class IV [Planctomycetota bacterium]